MLRRLVLLLLEFGAGLAGNLVAGYIQQDTWQNLFTPMRLIATVAGAAVMLVVIALLESEHNLAWNWRWHRFWYLRALANAHPLRRWATDFARLNLTHGRQPVHTIEVLADGERRDMVALLCEMIVSGNHNKRRLLVLGEPGSGKTTGLERLTWELARQGAPRQGWGLPIPVLLRLGNYQDAKLFDFAAEEMRHAAGGRSSEILSRGLDDLLKKGHVILLCDALDEALGERRELVLAEMGRLLSSRLYEEVPVVITTRTREDPGNRLHNLLPYTIQDLSDEAVRVIVHVYCQEADDEDEVLAHLEKAGLLGDGGLGRNPFWLQLVVASGMFQGRKGQILNRSVQTLLAREWDEKPATQRAGWARVLPKDEQLAETRWALSWLAYKMSEASVVSLPHAQVVHEILPAWLNERGSAGRLGSTDVVGLGRDAQLLVYWPGPLRFRHRLIQEAMTAQLLAEDEGLQQEVVARHAVEDAWWETLIMLGHLSANPGALVSAVIGDGDSAVRLFLAAVILQGTKEPEPALREQLVTTIGQSLAGGVTEGHRTAVVALAKIDLEDMVIILGDLLESGDISVQQAVLELLSGLEVAEEIIARLPAPALPAILHSETATLQWIATQTIARLGEGARQSALETVPRKNRIIIEAALAQSHETKPGAGVVVLNGRWLPDIKWGEVVPAGNYTVGEEMAWGSVDQQEVIIKQPYQLACYPVTYGQFQCFIAADDFDDSRWWGGMPFEVEVREIYEQQFPAWNNPRTYVSWYQAIAFCRWLSDKLGEKIDLPHEYEWEVAARYPDNRKYPWGNTFDAKKANTVESPIYGTTVVGRYPDGRNPTLDLYDLSGNVWEWCRNKYEDSKAACEDKDSVDGSNNMRTVRGGSWNDLHIYAHAASRYDNPPAVCTGSVGFRVVVRCPPSR